MSKRTIGNVSRDHGEDIVLEQEDQSTRSTFLLRQGTDIILMSLEEAAHLRALLGEAIEQEHARAVAPEPLRRFPALYERLQIHDGETGETWSEHRYVIEVGAGSDPTEGRAHVRLDGDESPGIDGVFLWDEDARAFYFKGEDKLYLIPVDASEET